MTLTELRQRHPRFIYDSYQAKVTHDGLSLMHHFTIEPDIELTAETIIHGVTQEMWSHLSSDLQNAWAFHIGLAEIPSYWKVVASPEIYIKTGTLTPDQQDWWSKLLIKGMGEYFYTNQIDFTQKDFVTWKSSGPTHTVEETSLVLDKNYLVPIGGGKDSALALCMFDQIHAKQGAFLLNPVDSMTEVAQVSDVVENIHATRKIDPKMLEMNQEGYLNGHVPFSAYLGLLARLAANLFGYQSVAIANERSSNEGNVMYRGHEINHQYSKTFEFEQDLNNYLFEHHLVPQQDKPAYFSVLRPWYEMQISHVFTHCPNFKDYAKVMVSCNRGRQTSTWCGQCSKCLFTFTSFYPFVETKDMEKYFGYNMFDNLSLYREALALVGHQETKPFDCVGTHEESIVGFYLAHQKAQSEGRVPPLLELINSQILEQEKDLEKRAKKIMASWNKENLVPEKLETALRTMLPIGDQNEKSIIIFGLGREGLSTYHHLRKENPDCPIVLMDQKEMSELNDEWQKIVDEDDFAQFCYSFDEIEDDDLSHYLLFKTPGVPTSHFLVSKLLNAGATLCSNTQLFFELVQDYQAQGEGPEIKLIGITGTKGKSTTSSFIQHVLKTAGLESYFGGNIGQPPLELWTDFHQLKKHQDQVYFVLELSSHQLAELKYSPQISVIQGVTPEHLDYYKDFEEYYQAKTAITRYQHPDDIVIFNSDSETATEMAELSKSKQLSFSIKQTAADGYLKDKALYYLEEKIVEVDDIPLKGKHNLYNTLPAIMVAKLLGADNTAIKEGIKSFRSLPHRLELVATIDDVEYYNDSIATTPNASIAAMKAFKDRPLILLVGGYERNQDYNPLAQHIIDHQVKAIVVFPPSGQRLLRDLESAGMSNELRANIGEFSDMKEAIYFVKQKVEPGDVVLLSPAAASFGMFEDYRDRGKKFTEAVKAIG